MRSFQIQNQNQNQSSTKFKTNHLSFKKYKPHPSHPLVTIRILRLAHLHGHHFFGFGSALPLFVDGIPTIGVPVMEMEHKIAKSLV
jgi:hypothetical protein